MDFSVDQDFVRVGTKSYAINKINSVEMHTSTKPGSALYVVAWLLAAVCAYAGLSAGLEGQSASGYLIVAAICGGVGWLSFQKRAPTHTYSVMLVTSSGEATAVSSTDADLVMSVRAQIETAIAGHRS